MTNKKLLVFVALFCLFCLTACTAPAPRPEAQIPVTSADRHTSNTELGVESPTVRVETAWTVFTTLKLATKTNVLWETQAGGNCLTEQLPAERVKVGDEKVFTSRGWEDLLYVNGDNPSKIYKKNGWGDYKPYEPEHTTVTNADGTVTESTESIFGTVFGSCSNTHDSYGMSLGYLYECAQQITTVTYRDWTYNLKGFCSGTGFPISRTLPIADSFAGIPHEQKETFEGITTVYYQDVQVARFVFWNPLEFTGNCKAVLNPKEEFLGVNCYKQN